MNKEFVIYIGLGQCLCKGQNTEESDDDEFVSNSIFAWM